ncbi:hypothetical protein TRFO_21869 [Tritrichomonas foetus]|uniref:Uncharacterized protein n=1 Tax=Tritrichomonas foetus TaxID=1144522 RepID=A0A1J4KHI5_9EUKA|nr:hypothetical protein TRFO_21869 [Tritrichomonas foetus]|eukprot:OHT09300.1 hypothetical protein TRFO_21869 [Tritrichomonas foetus]
MSLVRIQFDETSLITRFTTVDDKLDRHEEMIRELQKLLQNVPTRDELNEVRNELNKNIDEKVNLLNEKINDLNNKCDKAINDVDSLKNGLEDRLSQLSDFFNIKLRQKSEELSGLIPRDNSKLLELAERIGKCENLITENKGTILSTRDSVQHIATSIAGLNSTNASLDGSLPSTMNGSMDFLRANFGQIYEELNNIKEQLYKQPSTSSTPIKSSVPASPRPQITTPRLSMLSPRPVEEAPKSQQQQQQQQHPQPQQPPPLIVNISKTNVGKPSAVNHESVSKPDYDLTRVRPYPAMKANWYDDPNLPPIQTFVNLEDAIDFIYRLHPPLQAYLTAMNKKLAETVEELGRKIDRDQVDRLFLKIQSIIGELRSHIDALKNNLKNTATRDEINDIFEELMIANRSDSQTAVGRVRCMACGRETPQVTGALTEAELQRALGTPPNSIAYRSGPSHVGVCYNSRDGFDSEIVETPRSVRPFKQKRVKSKIKSPF